MYRPSSRYRTLLLWKVMMQERTKSNQPISELKERRVYINEHTYRWRMNKSFDITNPRTKQTYVHILIHASVRLIGVGKHKVTVYLQYIYAPGRLLFQCHWQRLWSCRKAHQDNVRESLLTQLWRSCTDVPHLTQRPEKQRLTKLHSRPEKDSFQWTLEFLDGTADDLFQKWLYGLSQSWATGWA